MYREVGTRERTGGMGPELSPEDTGPDWPWPAEWDGLRQRVGGRLIAVRPPLQPCREAPIGEACRTLFRELKNPYYIGDEVGLYQRRIVVLDVADARSPAGRSCHRRDRERAEPSNAPDRPALRRA